MLGRSVKVGLTPSFLGRVVSSAVSIIKEPGGAAGDEEVQEEEEEEIFWVRYTETRAIHGAAMYDVM